MNYLEIDGSIGEGGGQILRTALALSLCTGKPFCITKIRAKRKKPGLQRQHLTAVRASCEISGAQVEGDEMGSMTLRFNPNPAQPGHYYFKLGTAGSTTLVLQTVLYPLLLATSESHLTLTGGTHNPFAPPFDFLAQVFFPIINRMGPKITATLDRYGFYPKGHGQITVHIIPSHHLTSLSLTKRGKITAHQATALITGIPPQVAQRELQRVADQLHWSPTDLQQRTLPVEQGPGNVLLLQIQSEQHTEIFTGFGQRGVRAEKVADQAISMVQNYLTAEVVVGEYLADQLLLPFALAGEGEFITLPPSRHTLTNIEVIQAFLDIPITPKQLKANIWSIKVGG